MKMIRKNRICVCCGILIQSKRIDAKYCKPCGHHTDSEKKRVYSRLQGRIRKMLKKPIPKEVKFMCACGTCQPPPKVNEKQLKKTTEQIIQ